MNKAETTKKFGEEQVLSWRRSYDTPPPALEPGSEMHPKNDPRYREVREENLPVTECLKDTVARFLPFWDETIKPEILNNKSVLIVAHGNTLRALIKHLDQVTKEDIVSLYVPTGIPLVYELDDGLKPKNTYYLGDPEKAAAAAAAVEAQSRG